MAKLWELVREMISAKCWLNNCFCLLLASQSHIFISFIQNPQSPSHFPVSQASVFCFISCRKYS